MCAAVADYQLDYHAMAGKRLALLIANATYQHAELRKLNAPHNDVQALHALLRRPDIGTYETELLVDGTKGQMERAINRMLAKGEREDTALPCSRWFRGHADARWQLKPKLYRDGEIYYS
jgi:hypothetical protein